MDRKIVIAGNWKMNKSNSDALQLANQIKIKTTGINHTAVIMCPPFTALSVVNEVVKNTSIDLGGQNVFWEKEGAYTGEISAEMLKSAGASYVIIGHSERRQYFGETDETVNKRLLTALDSGLKAIVCVGETLEQRENNETMNVVSRQVKGALGGLTDAQMQDVIVAYEPVWAIGTGKTATPEQAQEVHAAIRNLIADIFNTEMSKKLVLQYGGSVKPENAEELLGQDDIDGALVGGACLKADSFAEIIRIAERLNRA
ncbi:MAG: triose-phosphate isomerase [Caldithrix sp.]|nr:triose-phosphate isomerase [Caldithrix sp.]